MKKKNERERANKDLIIRVRVTSDERERFSKNAKEKGYRTVSEYIRSLIADDKTKNLST